MSKASGDSKFEALLQPLSSDLYFQVIYKSGLLSPAVTCRATPQHIWLKQRSEVETILGRNLSGLLRKRAWCRQVCLQGDKGSLGEQAATTFLNKFSGNWTKDLRLAVEGQLENWRMGLVWSSVRIRYMSGHWAFVPPHPTGGLSLSPHRPCSQAA